MAKRKGTKGQTTVYKTLHRKLKIEHQEAHNNRWWTWKGKQFLLHVWHLSC